MGCINLCPRAVAIRRFSIIRLHPTVNSEGSVLQVRSLTQLIRRFLDSSRRYTSEASSPPAVIIIVLYFDPNLNSINPIPTSLTLHNGRHYESSVWNSWHVRPYRLRADLYDRRYSSHRSWSRRTSSFGYFDNLPMASTPTPPNARDNGADCRPSGVNME